MAGADTPGANNENIHGDAVLLIIYVVIALFFSFLCSIVEAVLLCITPSYIEGLKKKQPKRAALLIRLKQENADRPRCCLYQYPDPWG